MYVCLLKLYQGKKQLKSLKICIELQENADVSGGQILLYGALIRTDFYDKATVDEKKQIVEQLLVAGKKRDYLYLSCITFVIELCNKVFKILKKNALFNLIFNCKISGKRKRFSINRLAFIEKRGGKTLARPEY